MHKLCKRKNNIHLVYRLYSISNTTIGGYSIVELIAVVAILSLLSALAFPNITKWIALANIDSVKSALNSSASECLQAIREGESPNEVRPRAVSNESLSGSGYKIKTGMDSCAAFAVQPLDANNKSLYEFGFRIVDGIVTKTATPASDSGSLQSCKNWAGTNCGVTAEQQALWDAEAKIASDKKACNDNFYAWLQKPSSGSYNRWDETTKSCTFVTWAFEGSIQKDEAAVKSARSAKIGLACTAKLKEKETAKFDGVFTDPECGGTTYFCSGKDLATDSRVAYDACKEEEQKMKCSAALNLWKQSAPNGQFTEPGCTTMWKCGQSYYSSQADYTGSSCGCRLVSKQVAIGTKSERVKIGSTPVYENRCTLFLSGRCLRREDIIVSYADQYETQQVMQYETRQMCE